jgi:hypothetical protein
LSGARYVPFAYGFRPFFLAAGLYAVLAVGAWAWILVAGHAPFGFLPWPVIAAAELCFASGRTGSRAEDTRPHKNYPTYDRLRRTECFAPSPPC